jgi:hypothetical protein
VTIIVNGGDGNDQTIIGSPAAPASGLVASFQVNGQNGTDSLTIDDTAESDRTDRHARRRHRRGLGGTATFGTLEALTINAGAGADTINVQGTTIPTNVNAGGGNDTVAFADGANLSGGIADGGAGTNTLDYTAYATAVTVNLSQSQIPTTFLATLNAAQEPNGTSDSAATGTGTFILSPDQTQLAFTISYAGLEGDALSGGALPQRAARGQRPHRARAVPRRSRTALTIPNGILQGVWSAAIRPSTRRPRRAGGARPAADAAAGRAAAGQSHLFQHPHPARLPGGRDPRPVDPAGFLATATGTGGVRGFDNVTGGSAGDALTGNANVNVFRAGPAPTPSSAAWATTSSSARTATIRSSGTTATAAT